MSTTDLDNRLAELLAEFSQLPAAVRLEYLVECGAELATTPKLFATHHDLLERVEECQSPVYFALTPHPAPTLEAELDACIAPNEPVQLVITVPPSAPATRGFATLLQQLVTGLALKELHRIPTDLPTKLGLTDLISPLRLRGMSALISRVQRQGTELATSPNTSTLSVTSPLPHVLFSREQPSITSTMLDIAGLCHLYQHAPGLTRAGFVTTVDGAMSGPDERSGSLGTPLDQVMLSVLRANCDVVIVGAGTVRKEGYRELTLHPAVQNAMPQAKSPQLAVLSASGRLPEAFLERADPTIIFTSQSGAKYVAQRVRQSPHQVIVTESATEGYIHPGQVKQHLHELGLTRHLVEGGPNLVREYLDHQLLDEWCLTTSGQFSAWPQALRLPAPASGTNGYLPAQLEFLAIDATDSTLIQRWSQKYN